VTNLASKPPGYRSYILRCWEEHALAPGNPEVRFRFSLEDPQTGERHSFVTLAALTAFLQTCLDPDGLPAHPAGRE
jgi:hypothetical protein